MIAVSNNKKRKLLHPHCDSKDATNHKQQPQQQQQQQQQQLPLIHHGQVPAISATNNHAAVVSNNNSHSSIQQNNNNNNNNNNIVGRNNEINNNNPVKRRLRRANDPIPQPVTQKSSQQQQGDSVRANAVNNCSNNNATSAAAAASAAKDDSPMIDAACQQRSKSPKNFFHQLMLRSVMGGMKQHHQQQKRKLTIRPPLPIWSHASSLQLDVQQVGRNRQQQQEQQNGGSGSGGGRQVVVEHMAWDPQGILLATACSYGVVSIFDWDVVMAAHLQATSHSNRQRYNDCHDNNINDNDNNNNNNSHITRMLQSVPPIVQFQVPHAIATLQWNPSDPDVLAVGFRAQSYVHIYDVARVAEEQEEAFRRRQIQHNNASFARPSTVSCCYIRVGNNPNQHGTTMFSRMLFVDRHHVVIAHEGGHVSCWKFHAIATNNSSNNTNTSSSPRLVWRQLVKYSITCLANLSSDCIIVGGNNGVFTFLHWKCSIRAAFSSEPSAKVLAQWNTGSSLSTYLQEQQKDDRIPKLNNNFSNVGMGIQQVVSLDDQHPDEVPTNSIVNKKVTHDTKKNGVARHQQAPVVVWAGCRLIWVTRGGLVLEGVVCDWTDSQSFRITTIHHRPPLAQYRKWDGTPAVSSHQRHSHNKNNNNNSNNNHGSSPYSTPQVPLVSAINHTKTLLAWSKIPTVTWTLPHHDRLVVTGTVSALQCQRSQEEGIWLGWINSKTTKQPKQQQVQQQQPAWRIQGIAWRSLPPPRAISIHPSGEWIAIAKDNSVVLLKAYGKK